MAKDKMAGLHPCQAELRPTVLIQSPIGSTVTIEDIQERLLQLFEPLCDQVRNELSIAADNYSLCILINMAYDPTLRVK